MRARAAVGTAGPLAWYMNLNRGDRMDYLVSMSSSARGMDLYVKEHLPPGHPKRERKYINGDVNTCLIRTASGRTITLKHDTDLPRPYVRTNLVQGTRGIVAGHPTFTVCLDGPGHQRPWEPGANYAEKYEHPLYRYAKDVHARQPGIHQAAGCGVHCRLARGRLRVDPALRWRSALP